MLHTHSLIYRRRCIMFSTSTSGSPVSIIPQMLHTHSLIYRRRCIMFSTSTSGSPVSIIPPMLHTHSFIYHRRCIVFFFQYFSFPCQYYSTNAPYSFTHLRAALFRTNGRILGTSERKMFFRNRGAFDRKYFHLVLKGLDYPHLRSTVSTVEKQ